MHRHSDWGVLAIGIFLFVAPLALGLPGRAADGEEMIDAFAPIMDEEAVAETVRYYDDVFVPLGDAAAGLGDGSAEIADDLDGVLDEVSGGLDHYAPLVGTMDEQRANYDSVAGLPDLRLFSWFVMLPGLLLIAIALWRIYTERVDVPLTVPPEFVEEYERSRELA